MKKRTVTPFYGKREQMIEKQIATTQALAARVLDPAKRKLLLDKVTEMRADIFTRMARKGAASFWRKPAPWAPMPRKSFHVELGVEVANA